MAGTNATTALSAITSNWAGRLVVGAHPRRTLVRVMVLVSVAYVVFGHVLIPVRGQGPSMWPTLADGQLVFVNRFAYWRMEPRRGDVVAVNAAGGRVVYIKRIVGMPGERIRIDQGMVFVDGQSLDEPYVRRRARWQVAEIQLGPGEYLVIGDNRGMSQRNHDFGRARRDRLVGRVISW